MSLANSYSCSFIFFFYSYGDHRDLHSFPTRRSSDLTRGLFLAAHCTSAATSRSTMKANTVAPTKIEAMRSEEHTSELQSHSDLVCRLLLEKKKKKKKRQRDDTQ